jgi:enterochelin esterase-like enzyme
MKIHLACILGLASLAGCQAGRAAQMAGLPPGCETPGTVTYTYFVKASDDFPYEYGLYLPPCHEQGTGAAYPVLYLIPGAGGGRRDWFEAGAASMADELILTGEVPPFVIVTTQDVGPDLDAGLITDELMPYVDATYPVSLDRRYRAVAGLSAGGIAAYHIGLRLAENQAAIGMFGMGLVPQEADLVRTWLASIPAENRPRLFLNSCFSDPLETVGMARAMLSLLDQAGLSHTHIFNPGHHDFGCWGPSLPAFFHWLALGWPAGTDLR